MIRRDACAGLLAALCTFLAPCAGASSIGPVDGAVVLLRAGASVPAVQGLEVLEGDEIATGPGSEAALTFDDGSIAALRPGSSAILERLRPDAPAGPLTLGMRIRGKLRYLSGKLTAPHRVQFLTTSATIGVRGTDLEITVTPGSDSLLPGTYLRVNRGAALLEARDGSTETVEANGIAVSIDSPLTARGAFPLVRRLDAAPEAVFETGRLDALFR